MAKRVNEFIALLLNIKQLPPPAPPYTGGELITKHHDISMRRVLPLCKGELEGVVC